MKITIAHDDTSRTIDGNEIHICASLMDFQNIVKHIQDKLEGKESFHGWITIRDPQPDEHCGPDSTTPKPWRE